MNQSPEIYKGISATIFSIKKGYSTLTSKLKEEEGKKLILSVILLPNFFSIEVDFELTVFSTKAIFIAPMARDAGALKKAPIE